MSDPGLQPERTAMAWRRTQLTLLAGVVLLWRTGRLQSSLGTQAVVALLALIAVAGAEWRVRQLMRGRTAALGHLAAVQLLSCGGLCLIGMLTAVS